MRAFSLSFLVILSLLITSFDLPPQSSDLLLDKIERQIKEAMTVHDIPSVSVCVIRGGKIVHQQGYGILKRNQSKTANAATIYQVASLSKTMTGIIANNLIHEGRLDVEQNLLAYLPASLSKKARKKLGKIKVKDVFFHYAGLPHDSKIVGRDDGEPMLDGYTEEELLKDLEIIHFKKRNKKFKYSNLGYALAGYILERASGQSYQGLLEKYITIPYGLNRTHTELSHLGTSNLATPYRKEFRGMETKAWNTGKLVAASGVFSNIVDLSQLMLHQMKAYQSDSGDFNPLILTQYKKAINDSGTYNYGLGFFENETQRGTLYGHRGDMDGYAVEYSFNPSKNTGLILLTSSGGEWIGLLSAQINKMLEEAAVK